MATQLETLRQTPYFASLDEVALAGLLACGHMRRFQADEIVLLEGEPGAGLCVVLQGRVKVYKNSADGREQVLRILGAGRTCNDVAVFDGGTNPGSVVALEPTAVLILPATEVRELMVRHPPVAQAMVAVLASRLRAMTGIIEDIALRGVVARVAKLLLDCSQGKNPFIEGQESVCRRLTQRELANMTGSVPDVVQRALKTLERDGAIQVERAHVRILDPATLARWGRVELSDWMDADSGGKPDAQLGGSATGMRRPSSHARGAACVPMRSGRP